MKSCRGENSKKSNLRLLLLDFYTTFRLDFFISSCCQNCCKRLKLPKNLSLFLQKLRFRNSQAVVCFLLSGSEKSPLLQLFHQTTCFYFFLFQNSSSKQVAHSKEFLMKVNRDAKIVTIFCTRTTVKIFNFWLVYAHFILRSNSWTNLIQLIISDYYFFYLYRLSFNLALK